MREKEAGIVMRTVRCGREELEAQIPVHTYALARNPLPGWWPFFRSPPGSFSTRAGPRSASRLGQLPTYVRYAHGYATLISFKALVFFFIVVKLECTFFVERLKSFSLYF